MTHKNELGAPIVLVLQDTLAPSAAAVPVTAADRVLKYGFLRLPGAAEILGGMFARDGT